MSDGTSLEGHPLFQLNHLPEALYEPSNAPLLGGILRGIEKESLRTLPDGRLALSAHPQQLGSALAHPQITTDFSEALLEFITPPSHRTDEVIKYLDNIHRFCHAELADEILWCHSMPCILGEDADIPVARYGKSNVGRMKTIYREGLGRRYGRVMQTVAGIHYNFSLPDPFWAFLHAHEGSHLDLADFRTKRYFDLIRNFRRHYWLLIYLFGASPAVDRSFVRGRPHNLHTFDGDEQTLYMPYSTSLRMGDLGYQSVSQEGLFICYNQLSTYLDTLISAIQTPYPQYQQMGVRDKDGSYQQLNAGLLQIENEFYSAIRPKRTARTGETALTALCHRGVEYVEVRCLDLNPYEPLGISRSQMQFLDIFLLYCLLQPSPKSNRQECDYIIGNQKKVVMHGREPGLKLQSMAHGELGLQEWATDLLQALKPVAEVLDCAHDSKTYSESLQQEWYKVDNVGATPSARILADMREHKLGFIALAQQMSRQHGDYFRSRPLQGRQLTNMRTLAERSWDEQRALEHADTLDFDTYLARYYHQYKTCGCAKENLLLQPAEGIPSAE